jgi:hypothetical protein
MKCKFSVPNWCCLESVREHQDIISLTHPIIMYMLFNHEKRCGDRAETEGR